MAYSSLLAALTLQLWLLGTCVALNFNGQLTCVAGMFTDYNLNIGRSAGYNNNDLTNFDIGIHPRYESTLYHPAGREPLNQKMGFESPEATGDMGRNTDQNRAINLEGPPGFIIGRPKTTLRPFKQRSHEAAGEMGRNMGQNGAQDLEGPGFVIGRPETTPKPFKQRSHEVEGEMGRNMGQNGAQDLEEPGFVIGRPETTPKPFKQRSHEAAGEMGRNMGQNGAQDLEGPGFIIGRPETTPKPFKQRSDFRTKPVEEMGTGQLRNERFADTRAEETRPTIKSHPLQRSDFRNNTPTADEEQVRSALLPCGTYTLDDGEMVVISAEPQSDSMVGVFNCEWSFVPKISGSRLYLKCAVLELPTCDLSSCPADNALYVTITGQDGTLADIEYRKSIGELKSYGEIAAELDTEVTGSSPQVLCTVWAQSGFDDQGSSSSSGVLCSGGDCGAGIPTSPPSNGGVAQEGDWPSTGLVVAQHYSRCKVLCAVTLISHEYVLTSAACVLRAVASARRTNTYVVLGGHDLSDINDDRDEYEIDIQGSLTHPGYTWETSSHDIGLIKLNDNVTFTGRIQPACLPKEGASYGLQDRMFMPGWLEDCNGNRSPKKRAVQQSTWDWLECRDVYGDHMDLTMMCASGSGPCYTNKGGGLLWVGINGTLVVVGVASWSPGCGFTDAPTVYIDVAKFMDWLTRTMECDGEAWTPEVPQITPPVTCGKANSFEARIVNGTVAEINEFPWQAALVLKQALTQNTSQAQSLAMTHPFCGAAIISRTHLITTASCVSFVRHPHLMMDVLVGYHDVLDTSNTPKAARYGVRDASIHPDYNPFWIANDMAVILVDTPITFGTLVAPLCLPVDDSEDYDGVLATTSGWGKTDYSSSTYPTELNKVDVDIISNQACTNYYGFSIYDEEICAYGGGKDSCVGDGGSALIVQTPSGRWEAVGLVAWGIGCAWDGYPGVYTRVTAFLDWVYDNSYGTNLHRI